MSTQPPNLLKPRSARFAQKLVNQLPVYDRKLKIDRPRKKKNAAKFL
jgi:hypothetical protein